MKYFILLALIMTVACQKNAIENQTTKQIVPQITNASRQSEAENQIRPDKYESERFSDEHRIGKRRANRIELSTYEKDKKLFVKVKFYTKSQAQWIQKNEVDVEKVGGLSLEPEIKDFNGDGFYDITFISGIAARGANDVRDLFIYDSLKDELVHIKNSGDYPNLQYNPLLKCLDAWIFTGSTMTVFLKLKGDKLIKFASIEDRMTERVIYVTDRNGKERLLRREKRKDDGFDRYINFNPVQTYQD